MPLKDGIYFITNVEQGALVFLPDPNHRTPLQGHFGRDKPGELWHVEERMKQRYSIRSLSHQSFASSGSRAQMKDVVQGDSGPQLWCIQECPEGNYTISTTDTRNFWALPQDDPGTPVELYGAHTDRRCWWTFTNLETGASVNEDVTAQAMLFELKPLPIVPFVPLRLDFVVIQEMSGDSFSNASRTIREIVGPLVSLSSPQLDTIRANIVEFKPFESTIFFRRLTDFLPVEKLCDDGGPGISWKMCSTSSLPEMAIHGLRANATKVALLNLDATLLQKSEQAGSQAIINLIRHLVELNVTLILTPIRPTFYNSDVLQELRNISSESRLFEQMDEFPKYIADYNEMFALPRLIQHPELRKAILEATPHIIAQLKDHETRVSAVAALSGLAEHTELHDEIIQVIPHIMGLLKDEDHDVRSAAITALSKLVEHEDLRKAAAISKDNTGRTPLSWAAESGYDEVVPLLLDLEGDINMKDNLGRTPLLWAAENGRDAVVCLLLEKGVDVNAKDKEGDTPLSKASCKGQIEIVRLLLDHNDVEVNTKGEAGHSPLSWAASRGHDGVVRLLLAHKDVDINKRQSPGYTPLMLAAVKGHNDVVLLLLAHKDIDVNAKDNDGLTPLSGAANQGRDEVVKLLLAQPGVDVNSRSAYRLTPLMWAAFTGQEGVVRLLLAHKDVDVDARDLSLKTALRWAAVNKHYEVVDLLRDRTGKAKWYRRMW